MAHPLTTIGRHLECAIQTELVVEPDVGPTPNKKEAIFSIQSNSVICQKDKKAFLYIGIVPRSKAVRI